MEVHSFRHPDSLKNIKVFSDADTGGFSEVHMDLTPCPPGHSPEGQYYGRFHGNISIELPVERPKIQRSGYAAWRTRERGRTLFGRQNWDCDPYTYLALKIKSDGSKYFVNIQTDSIVETDIHQHRLFAKRIGEWETIHVRPLDTLPPPRILQPRADEYVDSLHGVCEDKFWTGYRASK